MRGATEDPDRPLLAAATVVVLRDAEPGPEILMLQRSSAHVFGGMWVFPGGKVEPEDLAAVDGDEVGAARVAAVRECQEEAGLVVDVDRLVTLSHWVPPVQAPKRFSTWFFLTAAPERHDVLIDHTEVQNHVWTPAQAALDRCASKEIELAPPTWMTLAAVTAFDRVADLLSFAAGQPPQYFATRILRDGDVPVSLWHGDAAYETGDLTLPGGRRRLRWDPAGWVLDGSAWGAPPPR